MPTNFLSEHYWHLLSYSHGKLRSDILNFLLDLVETGQQVKTYKGLGDTD